jgi:Holliday junction resolvase-like predicted endonuclease
MMRKYDIVFPEYGFAQHKGYGTKQHMEAIITRKASPIHRQSFNPVSHHLPTFAYLKRNRLIGRIGEQLTACQYIRSGHEILETNYTVPKIGEIDIISRDEGMLVFTEVKTKTAGHGWEEPRFQNDENKGDRIMNAVQHFMDENKLDCDFRFDVGEVMLGKGRPKIRILEEAIPVY